MKVTWPQIQGIDTADVRERLSDDVYLFQSMLKRLLGEFAGEGLPGEPGTLAALPGHAVRMHKLQGSAGLLGAKAIQELAREVGVSCVAGTLDRAAELTSRLAVELEQLQEDVAIALMPASGEIDAPPSESALEPTAVAELVTALNRHHFSATSKFSLLSPQLRHHLSLESFDLVRDHIENLRFREAAQMLEVVLGSARLSVPGPPKEGAGLT